MRHYAKNSPQAAARFLVLAALADGDLTRSELGSLETFPALLELGVDAALLNNVLAEFCEDVERFQLIDTADNFQLKPALLVQLLAEIDDHDLQRTLGHAALQVIGADRKIHRGESVLICAALDAWDLLLEDFMLPDVGIAA